VGAYLAQKKRTDTGFRRELYDKEGGCRKHHPRGSSGCE